MFEVIKEMAGVSGIFLFLLIVMIVWSSVWKLLGLWKAARKNSVAWFIILALVNTVGILEILYIYVFSERKKNNFRAKKKRKRR
jgi:hypothetical protein